MSPAENQNIVDDIDEGAIRDYTIVKWRTSSSIAQENLRIFFQHEEYSEYFSESYFEAIGERWRELQRVGLQLSIMFFAIVVFMGVVESGTISGISILGVRVSNDNSALPIMVLVASILLISSSIVSIVADHYESVVNSVPLKDCSDDIRNLYTMRFSWKPFSRSEAMTRPDKGQFAGLVEVTLVLLFFSGIVFAMVVLLVFQFFLFVSSVLFIFENPILPIFVNTPIIFLAGCAIILQMSSILLRLPLPYTDYSNLERLKQLEKDDPDKAERIWTHISERSLRKERRNVLILQVVSMLVAMIVLYLIKFGEGFFSNIFMLIPLAVATFALIYVVSPLLDKFERRLILRAAELDDQELRVHQYVKNKKNIFKIRLLVSLIFGLLTFLWFEII